MPIYLNLEAYYLKKYPNKNLPKVENKKEKFEKR